MCEGCDFDCRSNGCPFEQLDNVVSINEPKHRHSWHIVRGAEHVHVECTCGAKSYPYGKGE